MNILETSSTTQRRARTRSLIQLGGLIERAGLLEVFDIPLGRDLQKDPLVKEQIAILFKGLLVLKEMVTSKKINVQTWAKEGSHALAQDNKNAS